MGTGRRLALSCAQSSPATGLHRPSSWLAAATLSSRRRCTTTASRTSRISTSRRYSGWTLAPGARWQAGPCARLTALASATASGLHHRDDGEAPPQAPEDEVDGHGRPGHEGAPARPRLRAPFPVEAPCLPAPPCRAAPLRSPPAAQFTDGCFDIIFDKGALDAFMGEEGAAATQAVGARPLSDNPAAGGLARLTRPPRRRRIPPLCSGARPPHGDRACDAAPRGAVPLRLAAAGERASDRRLGNPGEKGRRQSIILSARAHALRLPPCAPQEQVLDELLFSLNSGWQARPGVCAAWQRPLRCIQVCFRKSRGRGSVRVRPPAGGHLPGPALRGHAQLPAPAVPGVLPGAAGGDGRRPDGAEARQVPLQGSGRQQGGQRGAGESDGRRPPRPAGGSVSLISALLSARVWTALSDGGSTAAPHPRAQVLSVCKTVDYANARRAAAVGFHVRQPGPTPPPLLGGSLRAGTRNRERRCPT